MAWNSTYNSRAGHFTLKIDEFVYTNKAAVSFTQERNLVDTLNKFQLELIDDGSSDFQDIEGVILSGLTSIQLSYGSSLDNMLEFQGFAYDFQPTFFADRVKLTLVGYCTKVTPGVKASAYGHYYKLDWSPMIPLRRNYKKNWVLFQDQSYIFERDSAESNVVKIEEEKYIESYDKQYKNDLDIMEEYLNTFAGKYLDFFSAKDLYNLAMEYIKTGKDSSYSFLNTGFSSSNISSWWEVSNARISYLALEEAKARYNFYENAYNMYFNKYAKGSFNVKIMDKLRSLDNAMFSELCLDGNKSKSIAMPIPDVFVQWDGILPKSIWKDNKWQPDFKSLAGTMCDVVAFALNLWCEGAETGKESDDKEDHPVTLAMDKKWGYRDGHDTNAKGENGRIRVLAMPNATFICVSDAKEIAEAHWGSMTGSGTFEGV